MYPNLRYAIYDIFGVDIPALALVQTYGFFLALAFLISGILLTMELKRRERSGWIQGIKEQMQVGEPLSPVSVGLNALLGFILGFKALEAILNPVVLDGDIMDFIFSAQGNWIGGIVLGGLFGYMKYYEKKQELAQYPKPKTIERTVMPHQRVSDLIILAAIGGIAGAKILYLLEYPTEFYKNPIRAILSGSGLTVYGGLILGFIFVASYARRKKIPFWQLADSVAPILFIAYGVGRLGCHFSGDGDWGDPNPEPAPSWMPDWLWSYTYPHNVIKEGEPIEGCDMAFWNGHCNELSVGVYPTAVYEFLLCTLLFALLWGFRSKFRIPGLLFFLYLFLNGLERFTIEIIRVNEEYSILGVQLTQAQAIASGLMLAGIIGMVYIWRTHQPLPPPDTQQNTSA